MSPYDVDTSLPQAHAVVVPVAAHAAISSSMTDDPSGTDKSRCSVPSWPRVQHLMTANALPLGFLAGLIWALAWPEPGRAVGELVVGQTAHNKHGWRLVELINNMMVFLVSGLTLRTSDFQHLAKSWSSIVYGLLSILLLTPVLALVVKRLPIDPPEFPMGLAIFSVVPTTLGVGVALTQAAHGNQALSLLLTVVTNMLGVVTVPFLLHLLLAGGESVIKIKPGPLATKLVFTVLIPTLVGMAIRASNAKIRHWITTHKVKLTLFSTFNLVIIIWQALSAARDILLRQSAGHLVLIALAAIVQHVFLLAFNWWLVCPLLRLPPAEAVAVTIMTAQKSAPVAVTVISYLADDVAQQGLFVIPCLLGQLSQIFIGSLLARKLAQIVDASAEEQEALKLEEEADKEGQMEGKVNEEEANDVQC